MYSASVLDMVVLFYFFDDRLTNLSLNSCILPDILFLVSWQPAWSVSAKVVRAMQESFKYHRTILTVPLRKWISDKRTKNQAKTDKTEHGMEKHEKSKSQSQSQPRKVNSQSRSQNQRNT
ncbi:hypothetical protein Tco_1426443 [Tanacetum coccineum]